MGMECAEVVADGVQNRFIDATEQSCGFERRHIVGDLLLSVQEEFEAAQPW